MTYNTVLELNRKEITRTCNVKVGLSSIVETHEDDDDADAGNNVVVGRLGLIATKDISKGDVIVNVPFDDRWEISSRTARDVVFIDILDKSYDGWTGDTGLIALQLLNEVARTSSTDTAGVAKPTRPQELQQFIDAWVSSLPTPAELQNQHPLLWSEKDQEILQSSSNTKIYRLLDDIEEDATWLTENVFEKDRTKFPESIEFGSTKDFPLFCVEGYKWAMAIAKSRTVFVDGRLRLMPIMDMCNHDDQAREVDFGTMGTFGTTKGAQLLASRSYKAGEEVFCSYGPKSAADYLLEHGFCPPKCWKTAVSEITLELDQENDRFYDDKLDILEFETYDQAPLDPVQSFDVVSSPGSGRDGEPDPAMIQFARLQQLGGLDAFLLESLFRKEVWGFMALPVSESNELAVVNAVSERLEASLEDLNQCPEGGPKVCTKLRESEKKALKRTLEYMLREKEALDLKEYYQERRLKDLGLDSDWSPEDDMGMNDNPDLNYGQTRAPGGADYDW
jgi:[ribulose-bisphosphate carboxylase]/[fructose-bisphosphate aldolase]-lysine N-methyltransferase